MLQLYKNIKMHRRAAGMTQEELAQLTGYTDRSSISQIERGIVDLSQSKIQQFADVFGVTPSELMGWEENEKPTVGEDDGLSDEKREAINAIYEALKNLPLEDLQAIGQVVAAISNRVSPEQPRD